MSEFYRRCQIFYPVASAPIEFGRLTKSLRLSIHPYPDFEENAATFAISRTNSDVTWLHGSYPDHKVWITEVGASSVTLGGQGQESYMWAACYTVCGPKPRVEALIFWPTTDAEGYAWNPNSPFYRFGVVGENGSTLKPSAVSLSTAFADPDWTSP